jgi:thiamine-monophosphate kinase
MASEKIDSEEAIIGAFFAPLTRGFAGAFDLADDCAALQPEPGTDLIVTTDAVVAGVHVFADEDPGAIAWKALAVNISDLTAKGAAPRAYLMMLSLPEAPERPWLQAFCEGLRAAQEAFGCHLVGGDTDRVPGTLSVAITAMGSVPSGRMVRRGAARPGDHLYVSGTIGDAALGLALRKDPGLAARCRLGPDMVAALGAAYARPQPPVALAPVLLEHARAAMDVSDGLVKDFSRMCRASGTGGRIDAAQVPLSSAARAAIAASEIALEDLLGGGEDYQALAAVAPDTAAAFESAAAAAAMPVTCIGAVAEPEAGFHVVDGDGRPLTFTRTGWDHFQS